MRFPDDALGRVESNTSFPKWEKESQRRKCRPVQSSAELGHEIRLVVQKLRTQALDTGSPESNPNSTVAKGPQ
jgi:hypothetical protein